MNEKRVIAFARGGIGNQMFIYAAARRVALRNGARLTLVTDSFENEVHGRHFLLDKFRISADSTTQEQAGVPYSSSIHKIAGKLNRYLHPFSAHFSHYLPERTKNLMGRRTPVDRRVLKVCVRDYLFLDGFFQNEGYFFDIRDTIRSDFMLKNEPGKTTTKLADEMRATESVCIHFRRTELEQQQMLEKHGHTKWVRGYPEGLGADFYAKALTLIEKNVRNPRYFCFSDHPEWVRDNMQLPVKVTYVSHNSTAETCHEDIYLMNQCRHHIISHSTFGWWGAWLASRPGQVVVAPMNVCGRPKPPDYPAGWKTIEVCLRKISQ